MSGQGEPSASVLLLRLARSRTLELGMSVIRSHFLFAAAVVAALVAVPCAARGQGARSDARGGPPGAPVSITDDAGTTLRLRHPAARVISLIPSATETLIAIGATDRIIGRTRYDVAPEVTRVPSVGGGLDPSVEAIVALHPDVVISWEHDRRQRTREKLTALRVPVLSLRTEDTTDAFRVFERLGALTGRSAAATALTERVHAAFRSVARASAGRPVPVVFYVVYNNPPMTASPATFIGQLIGLAGGTLAFPEHGPLWPTVSMEALVQRQPDVIVLPVGEKGVITLEKLRNTPGWRDLTAVREGRVATVPSNLVNRPGPRLGEAARALFDAIHSPAVEQAVRRRTTR
ncbi:MAG: btuF [Gemmatimonadetes bacterium]|nr:btuF [Gemmatimonadota bacterium]